MGDAAGSPRGTVNPEQVATEFGEKLASRFRHICVFVGAGAGKAAGLPDLQGLQEKILETLQGDDRERAAELLTGRNVEEALSRLRRIRGLLDGDTPTFGGFDADAAADLDRKMCAAIIHAVDQEHADLEPFRRLAIWAASSVYARPIEIFSASWDLLIESGMDAIGSLYFDGFVGTMRARFRPELVEETVVDAAVALPPGFSRVWKIHGSTNWVFEQSGDVREVIRLGHPAGPEQAAAIYPSDEKYEDSRRVPFIVLMDRLRRALNEPETLMFTTGYSFGDQHLNEIIFDAAVRRPRSEVIAFFFSDIPEEVGRRALEIPNLTALGAQQVVIGGQELDWAAPPAEIPSVWEGDRFRLGDFRELTRLLTRASAKTSGGE